MTDAHGMLRYTDEERDLKPMRIPREIWPALGSGLQVQRNIVVAWLAAVCKSFPGRSLSELGESKPELFPPFLQSLRRSAPIQVCTAPVKGCLQETNVSGMSMTGKATVLDILTCLVNG